MLRAARTVFVRLGVEATTREVAEAAGVSQAMLFQRWGTKKRLYFAAMLPRPPELDELFGESEAISGRAWLEGFATRMLGWLEASMPGSLRAALHPDFPDAVATAHAPLGVELLAATLADRLRQLGEAPGLDPWVDRELTAKSLLDALHGVALRRLVTGSGRSPSQEAADVIAAIFGSYTTPRP